MAVEATTEVEAEAAEMATMVVAVDSTPALPRWAAEKGSAAVTVTAVPHRA